MPKVLKKTILYSWKSVNDVVVLLIAFTIIKIKQNKIILQMININKTEQNKQKTQS